MGFGAKWVKWMSECYSTASLSILINGSPSKDIFMKRGLRQGDPLSSFLFLLEAEGLSRLLNKAALARMISGVEWSKNGDSLSHLQFADDTVLFCKAEMHEVQNLKVILKAFGVCSGLEINFGKSRCIGIGLETEETKRFADVIGCPIGSLPMNYLGMQVGANPGRLSTWKPILHKFKQKLASWRSADLSMAGRVVLIKSALSNLPLYYASMYKMPISVANEMEKTQRQFLWGSCECLVDKNIALLTKWWWKLVSGKGGLWRRMVLEKYNIKRAHDPREVSLQSSKLSKTWKDILKIVQGNSEVALAFREGMKLKLGNGKDIKFWHAIWMGNIAFKDQHPKLFLLAENNEASVSDMGLWAEDT
ncbi:hypothetical protein QQ045_016555 [Rhodiola kirilowii]